MCTHEKTGAAAPCVHRINYYYYYYYVAISQRGPLSSFLVFGLLMSYGDVQYNNNNIMYNLNHVHAHTTHSIVFVTLL